MWYSAMNLRALSIGEAVPRENFDAVIHSVFDSAVNLRLEDEDRLLTLLVSDGYELPQGIRIWKKDISLQTLTPGLHAAAKRGILRFDSSPLSVDMRSAPVWKCRIPELSLDLTSPVIQQAWSATWDMLNKEQRLKNTNLVADDLFQAGTGPSLSQRIRNPVTSLLASAEGFDLQGALRAAEKMIGLGPGVTPSGDDILIGFLAGLWSVAGQNRGLFAFIRSLGDELVHLAKGTSEISRTYIYHATRRQFSSALSHLAEAIATGNGVAASARSAMRIGHSSGMDSVTGLLMGLRVWNPEFPLTPGFSH